MRRRLVAIFAVLLAVPLWAVAASGSLSAGGPWVPPVLTVAAIDSSTWFATTDRGLFRTTDAGAGWTQVTTFPSAAGSAPAPSAFEPVAVTYANARLYAIDTGTLGVSADGGATWSWQSLAKAGLSPYQIAVAPDDPQRIAITMNTSDNFALSVDGGKTWKAQAVPDGISNLVLTAGGGAYAISGTAVKASSDGGLTWTALATPTGIAANSVWGLAVPSAGTLLAFGGATTGTCDARTVPGFTAADMPMKFRVSASTDGGATWTERGLVCTTGIVTAGGGWGSLAASGDRVAVLTSDPNVAVSDNGGVDFHAVARPPFASIVNGASSVDGDLLYGTRAGLVRVGTASATSVSTGIQSWNAISGVTVAPLDAKTLLAALADRGLYRSTDGGASWTAAVFAGEDELSGTSTVQQPQFRPGTDSAVFAVDAPTTSRSTPGLRIFGTTDRGATWTRLQSVSGYEPGGPVAYGSGRVAVIPVNAPRIDPMPDQACAVLATADDFATYAVTPLSVGGANPNCSQIGALAIDPADPQRLLAVGSYSPGNGSTIANRLYLRSSDGGATWTSVGNFDSSFPTTMWAPPMHVAFGPGGAAYIWQTRSSSLCRSTDSGATFSCGVGTFASTPGGPGWVAGGYLSAFDVQGDGSIIAAVVDQNDWTDPNSTAPENGVALRYVRSVDQGATWAVADQEQTAATVEITDIGAAGRKRSATATGRRRALIASTGVFRRTIAFKAPARGQATVGFASISTSRAGRVSVPVSCPRGKRCTGTIALTGRIRVSAVGFDLAGGSKRVTLVVPKAQRASLVRGVRARMTVVRTTGGTVARTVALAAR